ncbi:MAG TPA: DUF6152 family protein [Gammaproteobacteria bacterium]|nr:DUF6152 family protein [Gammaproteobacteria bacterium]
MKKTFAVWAAGLGFASSLQAHHNSGLFETTTPIRVQGVIAEVRFTNPHSMIFVDAVDLDGTHVRWAVENSGTLAMTRDRGFNETTVQVGDPIEACGYAPKRAYQTAGELAAKGLPRPQPWWGNWDKVITGRLLILKGGPAEHWSHYGPLEACQALLESQ